MIHTVLIKKLRMLPHTIVNSHFSHKNIFGKQYQHGKIQIYRFDWPFSRWIQKRSKPKVSTKRSRFKNLKKNRRSDNFWMLPCRNYSEATYDLSLEDFSIETELIIFTLSLIIFFFCIHLSGLPNGLIPKENWSFLILD